jgi:hypothetical protein
VPDNTSELDLTANPAEVAASTAVAVAPYKVSDPYDPLKEREGTRGDLARGLLWLLAFVIGGVLIFVGLGRLDGSVITQSIFPSLIALAGTALGFYFGSQTGKNGDASSSSNSQPLAFTPAGVSGNTGSTSKPPATTTSDTQTSGTNGGKAGGGGS